MKKLGIILMTACFGLALASCGQTEEPSVTSTSETITTTDTTTSETTFVDNSALKSKLRSLANNIDKMPDGAQMFFSGETTRLTSTDYTVPKDVYYTENEYHQYHSSTWDWLDNLKEKSLSIKSYALAYVRQLGVFVKTPQGKIKLKYDSVNDELNIIFNDTSSVYDIRTGYTPEGKIKIKAVQYNIGKVNFSDRKKGSYYTLLDYVEDEKCILIDHFDQYYERDGVYGHSQIDMMIESNMDTHEITHLIHYYEKFGDYLRDFVHTDIQTEKDGIKMVDEVSSENGQVTKQLYDQNGRLITKIAKSSGLCNVRLPLYELNGWDHVYMGNNNAEMTLEIGDKTYTRDDDLFGDEYNSDMLFDVYGTDFAPYITLFSFDSISYSEVLDVVKKYIGLTPKADHTEVVEELCSSTEELAKNREAFGITDFSNIDVSKFQYLWSKYDNIPYPFEYALELDSEYYIGQDAQTSSYFNLDYLSGSVNGSVEFNEENFTVNLKDLTITVPKNILLSEDLDYQAALVLKGSVNTVIAYGKISKYDGTNSLVLEFNDEDIELLSYIKNGSYQLELLVGVNSNGEFNRISNNLNFESNFEDKEFDLGTHVEVFPAEDMDYNVTVQKTVKITKNDNITISISYSIVDVSEKTEETPTDSTENPDEDTKTSEE